MSSGDTMKLGAALAAGAAIGGAIAYKVASGKAAAEYEKGKKAGVKEEAAKHWSTEPKICDTILDHIGNTPLVKINKLTKEHGVKCRLLAKCEFFNAGGSVKDRIGRQMILDAEKSGRIKKGDVLIEPTSGNTGIGLALSAAVLGYKMVIALPKKMSAEKVNVLNALGATVKRTPTNAPCVPDKDPSVENGYMWSHIKKAKDLEEQFNAAGPDQKAAAGYAQAHILDQYKNKSNPEAHIKGTAEEVWRQTDGKIDMLVVTAGTGGTVAGMAHRLKQLNPDIIIVGVDPHGSILAEEGKGKIRRGGVAKMDENGVRPKDATADASQQGIKGGVHDYNSEEVGYKVEGIGYDFIPEVLSGTSSNPNARKDKIDQWYKTSDEESFVMARQMIRKEGLLCGGSCGSAMVAALDCAKDLRADQTCVVLLADSTRNYMTKFLTDSWMATYGWDKQEHLYKPKPFYDGIKDLDQSLGLGLECTDDWQDMPDAEDKCPGAKARRDAALAKAALASA